MTMPRKIKTAEELYEYFHALSRASAFHQKAAYDAIHTFVYVSNKVRSTVLLSTDQGKTTLNGRVYNINFESRGCGVWLAAVNKYVIDN